VVVAALKRLAQAGSFAPDETVVAFITGAGLKTREAVEGVLPEPVVVMPTIASFEEAMARRQEALMASKG
jgi:threonine synthase